MAELIIQTEKIKDNIKTLSSYFNKHDIHWSLITKVFSGDQEFLKNLLTDDVIEKNRCRWRFAFNKLKKLKSCESKNAHHIH